MTYRLYKPLNNVNNIPSAILENLATILQDAMGKIRPGRHEFIPVGPIMIVNCSDIQEPIEQVKVSSSDKKPKEINYEDLPDEIKQTLKQL